MARTAGKAKTRKGFSKRFKLTGSGRLKRSKQGKRHMLQNKNRKRKRKLGQTTLVSEADEKRIKRQMLC